MTTTQTDMRTSTTPGVGCAGGWKIGPLGGLAVISVVLTLTGCGTYGEPLLLARMYDSSDPCQIRNNGGNFPSFCGAGSSGRTTVYRTPNSAPLGQAVGYTKTK